MKHILLIILVLTVASPAPARGASPPRYVAHFTGAKVTLVEHAGEHLTVSESCEGPRGAGCQARRALGKLSLRKLDASQARGESDGSLLCERQAEGTVVVGTNARGDENSYCRFKDGSLVDNGSLVWRARLNDEKNP